VVVELLPAIDSRAGGRYIIEQTQTSPRLPVFANLCGSQIRLLAAGALGIPAQRGDLSACGSEFDPHGGLARQR
jgi:hypothetical protein